MDVVVDFAIVSGRFPRVDYLTSRMLYRSIYAFCLGRSGDGGQESLWYNSAAAVSIVRHSRGVEARP